MITIKKEDVEETAEEFVKGKDIKSKIYVEFDDVNTVDTLVLLRVFNGDITSDTLDNLAELMLDGHTISLKTSDTDIIKVVSYNKGNGNKLSLMFNDMPYLYDNVLNAVYTILLKKLTPHLDGSK
jgi:hypothetical protein